MPFYGPSAKDLTDPTASLPVRCTQTGSRGMRLLCTSMCRNHDLEGSVFQTILLQKGAKNRVDTA
jgi:hypothetical protein